MLSDVEKKKKKENKEASVTPHSSTAQEAIALPPSSRSSSSSAPPPVSSPSSLKASPSTEQTTNFLHALSGQIASFSSSLSKKKEDEEDAGRGGGQEEEEEEGRETGAHGVGEGEEEVFLCSGRGDLRRVEGFGSRLAEKTKEAASTGPSSFLPSSLPDSSAKEGQKHQGEEEEEEEGLPLTSDGGDQTSSLEGEDQDEEDEEEGDFFSFTRFLGQEESRTSLALSPSKVGTVIEREEIFCCKRYACLREALRFRLESAGTLHLACGVKFGVDFLLYNRSSKDLVHAQ